MITILLFSIISESTNSLIILPAVHGLAVTRMWYVGSINTLAVVQLLGLVWLSATPWTAPRQASLFSTVSWSLLKLMFIESVMPSNHLTFCCLLLLPSIFPSIRVFFNELALHIRWLKHWLELISKLIFLFLDLALIHKLFSYPLEGRILLYCKEWCWGDWAVVFWLLLSEICHNCPPQFDKITHNFTFAFTHRLK